MTWDLIFTLTDEDINSFYRRNASYLRLTNIQNAVVVQHTWKTAMQYKLLVGLLECRTVFFFIFLGKLFSLANKTMSFTTTSLTTVESPIKTVCQVS